MCIFYTINALTAYYVTQLNSCYCNFVRNYLCIRKLFFFAKSCGVKRHWINELCNFLFLPLLFIKDFIALKLIITCCAIKDNKGVKKNKGIIVYEVDNPKLFKLLNTVMLIKFKHQGLTVEKSSVQKLNQGERANVLNIIRS
jgi:hypothetical protein